MEASKLKDFDFRCFDVDVLIKRNSCVVRRLSILSEKYLLLLMTVFCYNIDACCFFLQNITISFAGTFDIENDVACAYDYINVMGPGASNKHGKYIV